jgi:hypothetical protein
MHYAWTGRTMEYHRAQIRQTLGFREATVQDAEDLAGWLVREVIPPAHRFDHLQAAVYARCRGCHLEPPTGGRIERIVRSAFRTYEDHLYHAVLTQIGPPGLAQIDALLASDSAEHGAPTAPAAPHDQPLTLQDLKADPGRISLASMLTQIGRLQRVRQLGLPHDLFAGVSPKLVRSYRQRAAAETPSALRAHSDAVRATLIAALCVLRRQELTDGLVDLLIGLVHKIGARAERRVEKAFLADLKRVTGKTNLLYQVAEAAVEHPDGVIRDVLYPLVGEQTLHDLVREYKSTGPTYRLHVQTHVRASYRSHYRRVLPALLEALEFRSNNAAHRPLIRALDLLKRSASRRCRFYALNEEVPLEGVVPAGWLDPVIRQDAWGRDRSDRITYEICGLQTLRDKLRCKEVWVVGADRYRNPDDDLPADFDAQRAAYYDALRQPVDAESFVTRLRDDLTAALTALDRELPKNKQVQILPRAGGWIKVTPLDPQPEPATLVQLKQEIGQRWPMTNLLDMLKEADLRVGFTRAFTSIASREALDADTVQRRLLLCLYGVGTNTGLKRIAAGEHDETYQGLRYVRRRYLTRDNVRRATAELVHAILQVRQPHIWGAMVPRPAPPTRRSLGRGMAIS